MIGPIDLIGSISNGPNAGFIGGLEDLKLEDLGWFRAMQALIFHFLGVRNQVLYDRVSADP